MSALIPLAQAGERAEDSALRAAESWLALVDAGEYDRSWEEAASLFRNAVTKEQWVNSLGGVRKPLGRTLSRTVLSRTLTLSLPGVPDGEYVVIQYRTSYKGKREAVETVTPMKDKDGSWRVSGYYIK